MDRLTDDFIDEALRTDAAPARNPFFARSVMRRLREPQPLAFPWKRVAIAMAAGIACAPFVSATAAGIVAIVAVTGAALVHVVTDAA